MIKIEEKFIFNNSKFWDFVALRGGNSQIEAGGWISYLTGEPFSESEINEYSNNTLVKLKPYINCKNSFLEIGVGSGVILQKISSQVKDYTATDISSKMINFCKDKLVIENKENVKFENLEAKQMDELLPRRYEVIIINSVCQYFPSIEYFEEVIAAAHKVSKENTIIFLGDIPDVSKKAELIRNAQRNNSEQGNLHREMFYNKDYLYNLYKKYTFIKKIEISEKIFSIENELTSYRFDCILTVKGSLY
ncbi:class I SAM-dependent methyltransferase [Oceanobacillus sp. CFH 90083]|uniref:class I SAM-dependent methyltransferase n=1 Tax=Oceanobacillus sp. CFH 90083 TaxID=2592336 RepID=UPI00128AF376|nr:class I SAM-dependent methyltransferase [Oceanobacillus sp. CFH 90083]